MLLLEEGRPPLTLPLGGGQVSDAALCFIGHFVGPFLSGQQVARTSYLHCNLLIRFSNNHVKLLLFADKNQIRLFVYEFLSRLFSLDSFLPFLVTIFSHLNEEHLSQPSVFHFS